MPMILIPSYHKGADTEWLLTQCVESIKEFCPKLLTATIIIDDASPEFPYEFYDKLKLKYGIGIMRGEENRGYSANINRGLSAAHRHGIDWVVTLNNDCQFKMDPTGMVYDIFNADPQIAVCGGKLYYPSGRIQACGFEVNDEGQAITYESYEWHHAAHEANRAKYVMGVTGAMQFINLTHIDKIGLYDEKYALGFEDVEFCMRTWNTGCRIFYQPAIYGLHVEGATRGCNFGKRELESYLLIQEDAKIYGLPAIRESIQAANHSLTEALSLEHRAGLAKIGSIV